MVAYHVLGPLEVVGDSGPISLGGNNQRRLLGVLLAGRDREVTVSALAEALWPRRPPGSELQAVQTVVSRARRALGEHRSDLVTTPDGYKLASIECDASSFDEAIHLARSEPQAEALELLGAALNLWRGDAFGVLSEIDVIRPEAIRLDEARLNTIEDRFALLHNLGRWDECIPEMEAFVANEPMRERSRGLLMQALYWTRRQSDALAVYGAYRDLMGDGLGLEPSLELKNLEESIVLDTLESPTPRSPGGARLFGRLGKEISTGPGPIELERSGWDLLWDHDHDGAVDARQRAYVQLLESGDRPGAARLAIWLGVNAAIRLKNALAFGWLGRAHQLLEGEPPGPSHGLLVALIGMVEVLGGELDAALEHSTAAESIGIESGNLDVEALGKAIRGWAMIRLGDTKSGMALMDQAMASAIAGELGEYISALVYCRTLCACLDLMDYERATAWTNEIARVRDSGGVADLPGDCRTHRLAVLLMKGDWEEGEREAIIACAETEAFDMTHLALAKALRGEIMLRRGDLDGAASELAAAQEMGASPYPGLALLRLARGDLEGARDMILHAAAEVADDPLRHAYLLPAVVEIGLATGDTASAVEAAETLADIAGRFRTSALNAHARHATGSVQLATGDIIGAVRTLRSALRRWTQVGSVYRAASSRMLLAKALLASGRVSDAVTEAAATREVFTALGATLDIGAVDDFLDGAQRSG